MGASKELKLAVVGTGIFATDSHLPAIKGVGGLEVAGCYNRTKAKAETFAEKAGVANDKVYESLEDVFKDDEVDFVDALLPVQYNLDVVKLATKYKKPLAFEKPIASNLELGKQIVEECRKSDVPIAVLENWVFSSAIKILKEEVLPKIGEPVSFTYKSTGAWRMGKYHGTSWRQKPEHIGGYLSDGGVHQLALLTEVLGPVDTVSALTTQLREASGDEDTMFSTLMMKNGVIGTYTYGSAFGATDKSSSFMIYGRNGSVVYDFSPHLEKPTITYQTGEDAQSASKKVVIEVDPVNTLQAEFANFKEAVQKNSKDVIGCLPETAYHHFAIVVAGIESSKKKGNAVKVSIP